MNSQEVNWVSGKKKKKKREKRKKTTKNCDVIANVNGLPDRGLSGNVISAMIFDHRSLTLDELRL